MLGDLLDQLELEGLDLQEPLQPMGQQVIRLLMEKPDLEFGLQVGSVVAFAPQAVFGPEPVFSHHDDRSLHRCPHAFKHAGFEHIEIATVRLEHMLQIQVAVVLQIVMTNGVFRCLSGLIALDQADDGRPKQTSVDELLCCFLSAQTGQVGILKP